jgi:anti-sigma-K factor RskA
VLLASGLAKPPTGRAYEIWVIGASKRPVPAGVFQPGPDGSAVVSLPRVEETARPATFAVTEEPAAGSAAPTSPILLAGAVS